MHVLWSCLGTAVWDQCTDAEMKGPVQSDGCQTARLRETLALLDVDVNLGLRFECGMLEGITVGGTHV